MSMKYGYSLSDWENAKRVTCPPNIGPGLMLE